VEALEFFADFLLSQQTLATDLRLAYRIVKATGTSSSRRISTSPAFFKKKISDSSFVSTCSFSWPKRAVSWG
jgi:hypothetical protein